MLSFANLTMSILLILFTFLHNAITLPQSCKKKQNSTLFLILVIRCDPLEAPRRGNIECSNDNVYQSVCRHSCNTGYTLLGSEIQECRQNGKWSNSMPNCRSKKYFFSCCCGCITFLAAVAFIIVNVVVVVEVVVTLCCSFAFCHYCFLLLL